jgi:hypothetical protein
MIAHSGWPAAAAAAIARSLSARKARRFRQPVSASRVAS